MVESVGKRGVKSIIDEVLIANGGHASLSAIETEVRIRTRIQDSAARYLVKSVIDKYSVENKDGIPVVGYR